MRKYSVFALGVLMAGCSAYTDQPRSFVLPTSSVQVDVVLHRSDVRLLDCGTLAVIQTYSGDGKLIDSKEARGSALHCGVINAAIEAGGRVGGAYVGGLVASKARSYSGSDVTVNASATGGAGGAGGTGNGGEGGNASNGGNGNNGFGNGGRDGVPGGSNHQDNNR